MTMVWPELIVVDVGHGNCAILKDTDGTVIIDCGLGTTLLETLNHLKIRTISSILISHGDEDHIGGIINLLAEESIKVQNIFLNADSLKRTRVWKNLRRTLSEARKRAGTKVHVGLTTAQSGEFNVGQVTIEILAPTPELAMSGVGGEDLHGNRLDSNSMSVVIGLVHNAHRVALLPGDIDSVGFRNLVEEHDDMQANILVFPHHGGKARSADNEEFAHSLCDAVLPKVIFFSIDRNHFLNPREEVMRGIYAAVPQAHIMCTQLSRRCSIQLPDSGYTHLSNLPAKGRESNHCCGGTVAIKINGAQTGEISLFAAHRDFVNSKVSTPLCWRSFTKVSAP